jgi:hypothetical protein
MTEAIRHPLAPRPVNGWQLDPECPLHQLFLERMENDRDLKIIITAKDAETGVGKSTAGFALAASWHPIYTDEPWSADEYGSYDIGPYLEQYLSAQSGSVLQMEEAEQLDSRRGMASENVDFSHYWMAMRVRQIVSILTLPSTSALDKRLWQLADVWINVESRGDAAVYRIGVNSFNGEMYTEHMHQFSWPDVSDHDEMQKLDREKDEKIERGLGDIEDDAEDLPSPKEVRREHAKQIAQRLREWEAHDLTGKEIGEIVDRSHTWVYNHTNDPQKA